MGPFISEATLGHRRLAWESTTMNTWYSNHTKSFRSTKWTTSSSERHPLLDRGKLEDSKARRGLESFDRFRGFDLKARRISVQLGSQHPWSYLTDIFFFKGWCG